ncbi:M protein repeat protein [Ascosphaera apis ARSEF 7405]|uniref:M protein repeat protein n=1 Tax=Ascosphaera apis ARSEF 7405 TaxID=392613 RepID=A0A168BUM5_9EURO|nr:M protein repeat protein [Ascosphaera apis ARSEF 7405]
MTSPQGSKASKWGSFLQQAVAGVESRLDTMLATEEEEGRQRAAKEKIAKEEASPRSSLSAQRGTSRSSSTNKTNDRLQERLAKAIARKGSPISVSSRDEKSRTSGSSAVVDGRASLDSLPGRTSVDAMSAASDNAPTTQEIVSKTDDAGDLKPTTTTEGSTEQTQENKTDDPGATKDAAPTTTSADSKEGSSEPVSQRPSTEEESKQLQSTESTDTNQRKPESEREWQVEMHEYIEKIDALQSKLKYLAQQAAESAKSAAASAAPGSIEKKLREKDEQIANLMQEGNKLSKTELENRATIKKLRQFIAERNKAHMQLQDKVENYEDELEKKDEELSSLKEAEKKNISELNEQLSKANAKAGQAEQAAQTKSLEAERRKAQEAQDDLTQLKLEKEISDNKFEREIKELKDSVEHEKEKSRLLEIELDAERAALEQKMETLRSQAEEASSSASGDAHAKLLRQVETLQSQYSIASENWQRIEGSLVARISAVEKERDEMEKNENEVRKKLREANLRAKKSEAELEASRDTIQELQRDLEITKQKLDKVTRKLEEAEQELINVKEEATRQMKLAETTLQQRIEEEKVKWQESLVPDEEAQPISDSPMPYSRKSSWMEQDRNSLSRPRSSLMNLSFSESMDKAPLSFRHNSTTSTPSIILGRQSSNDLTMLSSATDTPSIHPLEADEDQDALRRPSMQDDRAGTHVSYGNAQSRGVNDLISASTVGAGPSVQLVERMSATVRRLESEREASKDELARLTTQRDEARQEVVALMREVEDKRKCDDRIKELESTIEDLDQRYNTTLEMLGEKSEQVEELQADVVELKRIYRELVDSTMK